MELQKKISVTIHTIFLCLVVVYAVSIVSGSTLTYEERIAQLNLTDKSQWPPEVLPDNASRNNETALKILSKSPFQELDDIKLDNKKTREVTTEVPTMTTPKPGHIEPTESDVAEIDENLKNEVEDIQKNGDSDEESIGLEEQFHKQQSSNLVANPEFAEDIETNINNLHGGHITAIFAGAFAFLAVVIYVGLISWRSYLEKRYGMREQLVTEDDYYNNNDIRHFAL